VTGPQLLRGVSHSDYHGDLLPGSPRFSRSIAVRLLQQSPLHALAAHPTLGGKAVEEPEEDAQAQARMDTGSLLHLLLLGAGQQVAVIEHDSWRTNAAKDAREEARSSGLLPVLAGKYFAAQVTATAIRHSLARYGIHPEAYESEATALWESNGVACKARMDLLNLGLGEELDLKIVDRINLRAFEASVERYGLDVQNAAYVEAVETIHPPLAGRVSLEFVLAERLPPHDVAIVPLSPALVDLGRQKWRRAQGIWRRCLESDVWPGFGRCAAVEARPWQLEQEFTATVSAAGEPAWSKEE
jgi:hypothetical protein